MSTDNEVQLPTLNSLLTRKQAADLIGVSERTISNMVKARQIPVLKIGRSVRFDRDRVLEALAKYRRSTHRSPINFTTSILNTGVLYHGNSC